MGRADPGKYFDWLARGKKVWAPHCTVHRNMMGLYDMYAWTGNQQALEILLRWARWFHRWRGNSPRNILTACWMWKPAACSSRGPTCMA